MSQFSFHKRAKNLNRLQQESFDLLIIGGGITGAAVARDATSRGLKVALVEKRDFAWGTSSRSSKLIHGGLRYLENLEFKLVFEALAERTFLTRTAPHMVKPLPFYLPTYEGDAKGKTLIRLGLWLYDLLALFRSPRFHQFLSREKLIQQIPFLNSKGLTGGFHYYDASMKDDGLVIETLRAADREGAVIVNYVSAQTPLWDDEKKKLIGFRVQEQACPDSYPFDVRAKKVVVCAGPWTDLVGQSMEKNWSGWLNPSKGVHLVFDLERLPIPGAIVMSHPSDGRISFVIPRPEFGRGVVIVGTTDSPSPEQPETVDVTEPDISYLMELLNRYFPKLQLTEKDIVSAYVGIRPLFKEKETESLQSVSREHHIGEGPGGSVIVAGGKYTTHRTMAQEIVDFTLKDARPDHPLRRSRTTDPVNPKTLEDAVHFARMRAHQAGHKIPEKIWSEYGGEALDLYQIEQENQSKNQLSDEQTPGFPYLETQLRFAIREGMVLRLDDFYFRRIPLFLSCADGGEQWLSPLAAVWAYELGKSPSDVEKEIQFLKEEIRRNQHWKKELSEETSISSTSKSG